MCWRLDNGRYQADRHGEADRGRVIYTILNGSLGQDAMTKTIDTSKYASTASAQADIDRRRAEREAAMKALAEREAKAKAK